MRRFPHICFLLPTLLAPASAQGTWFVDDDGAPGGTGTQNDPFPSITAALTSASVLGGDEVRIADGTYTENLCVTKDLTLVGTASTPAEVVIDGSSASTNACASTSVVLALAPLRLQSLTLRNGEAAGGGGLNVSAPVAVDLDQVVVEDCNASRGGGIYTDLPAQLSLTDCTIRACTAMQGGGLYLDGASLTMTGGSIREGLASGGPAALNLFARGGGLCALNSQVDLRSVEIAANTSLYKQFPSLRPEGGGLFVQGGSLSIHGSLFEANVSGGNFDQFVSGHGGGAWVSCETTAEVLRTEFRGNIAGGLPAVGGGWRGPGYFEDCLFFDNRGEHGGGIASEGCDLELFRCTLRSNRNDWNWRGGAGAAGPATLRDCLLETNRSQAGGGGAVDCELFNCVVRDNRVETFSKLSLPARGAGLWNCEAEDCLIEGNFLDSLDIVFGLQGGGAYGGRLVRCTLRNNEVHPANAGEAAGGGAAEAELERCILIGNHAGLGGGVYESDLVHCTLTQNTALFGGSAIDDTPGSPNAASSLVSCIVWNHAAPAVVTNASFSATFSDIEGGWVGNGNIDADPLFWYPVSGDVNLKPGSPAIDQGDPQLPADPDGSRADMGALWAPPGYAPEPGNYCAGNLHSEGCRAALSASGSPTLSGSDDFTLNVELAPAGQTGIFIWSSTPNEVPFQGATLCLSAPIVRGLPVTLTSGSACQGSASQGLSQALLAATLSPLPYTTGYAQFWFRDPSQPPSFIGLSDALEFTTRP